MRRQACFQTILDSMRKRLAAVRYPLRSPVFALHRKTDVPIRWMDLASWYREAGVRLLGCI
jgi:hypothetical protein